MTPPGAGTDLGRPDVRLRPVQESDLSRLAEGTVHGPDVEHDDFGPLRPAATVRDEFEEHGFLRGADGGRLVVEADGAAVGDLSWWPVRHGPVPGTHAWQLGVGLVEAARGRGVGRRAQRLLAEHLFLHTPANRVEASTDVTNVAEQRALEAAGFIREGVLRGAQFRRGTWHDLVVYAVLRRDVDLAEVAARTPPGAWAGPARDR